MPQRNPIRRNGRRASRRGAERAFWFVLFLALVVGAVPLVMGFPKLLPVPQAQASAAQLPARMELRPSIASGSDMAARPLIAIVIDDLGADVAHTRRAIALPRQVALAFLPYPRMTPQLARDAGQAGHEVLVHLPMQAEGAHDPGPMALAVGLSRDENLRRLDWALARVPGFVGVNNHEGSKFTADAVALGPVMARIAKRGVFFFDSRTTPASQAVTVARAHGMESSDRDVFLDDVVTIDAVDAELRALEAKARARGAAIAIGHPNEITLDAVAYWAAHEQGFELVTLRDAIRAKTERSLKAMR
jgi:polysaccharide deacetylase 2 family uncharacterized protein YibQ